MPLKYFRIDGVATHLHHRGATTLPESPPDCSRGATVLCLHGTGGNAGDFAPVLDTLADEHSPLAFDQPGHGRSGSLDSLGAVDRMRDFTRALAEKLALPPQVLVGHSLGAAVAIDSALETPDAVRGVVAISAGAAFDLSDELMDRARLVTEGKRRRDFDPKAFVKGTQPGVIRGAYMASLKTDPRATYGDLLALRDWDRTADLGRLSVPVLALHGEGERDEVVRQAERLVDAAPNARREVIAGAGPMILFEQPEALATAIAGFLGEIGATGESS